MKRGRKLKGDKRLSRRITIRLTDDDYDSLSKSIHRGDLSEHVRKEVIKLIPVCGS